MSVEGAITVYSPVTLTPSSTLVTVGGLLQYVTGSVTNPTGWYFVAAVATTQASQVGFTPAGSIGATNVQDAIVELDGDVITNSNDIFTLQGDYNSLVAADAGLQSQITDNADAIAGLSSPAAADVTFVPFGTIVATNVQNALQELDGDKLAIAGGTMTGILSSNKFKNGISGTPANNFLLDASANNGTMKLARESGQDIMTVDAAGKPRFNQLAQLLSGSGYKVLEGGIIIQWGVEIGSDAAATGTTIFPIAFPNTLLSCVLGWEASTAEGSPFVTSKSSSQFTWNRGSSGSGYINWMAIGY